MSKPNWDQIRREWETTKKTYKELEEKFNVKSSTIRSRKNREKWERNSTDKKRNTVATKKKGVATQRKIKEPVVQSDNLTEKQRLFCIYYIKYFNATKAYQKAYECEYVTANVNGSRLLVNASISSEIDRMKRERNEGLKLDNYDVLQKYIDIAFSDIGDYVNREEDGFAITVKPLDQMDTSIISELSNTENGIKLKLSDKMKALDMLAKYTDLLSNDDKKKLQEEKLKVDIDKTNAEIEKISGDDNDGPIEIMITRKGDG